MKRIIFFIFVFILMFFCSSFAQIENTKNIDVSVEVQKELFPVVDKFISEGNIYSNIPGLVKWKIHNKTNQLIRISFVTEIPEWTSPIITAIDLSPNEYKELTQTPFGNKLLGNHTTVPATILLKARTENKDIFEETRNIRVRAADDMVWSLYSPLDTESLISAWVTPNNNLVEQILSNAKEKLFGRSLGGYQNSNIRAEIKAIFNAVRNAKISYVNSTMSFGKVGFTQRVRLPQESISEKSANCIDGSVLFASLFENIGLEPLIVLIPGHAFVGIRLAPNSGETLFIETTMVGRSTVISILSLESTFDAAEKEGNREFNLAKQNNPSTLRIIDIKKARAIGIYPLL